jgi:hypothetical protein
MHSAVSPATALKALVPHSLSGFLTGRRTVKLSDKKQPLPDAEDPDGQRGFQEKQYASNS